MLYERPASLFSLHPADGTLSSAPQTRLYCSRPPPLFSSLLAADDRFSLPFSNSEVLPPSRDRSEEGFFSLPVPFRFSSSAKHLPPGASANRFLGPRLRREVNLFSFPSPAPRNHFLLHGGEVRYSFRCDRMSTPFPPSS